MGGRYKHNQQLEELRNLQERLVKEKKAWYTEKETLELEMETKKKEMSHAQVKCPVSACCTATANLRPELFVGRD